MIGYGGMLVWKYSFSVSRLVAVVNLPYSRIMELRKFITEYNIYEAYMSTKKLITLLNITARPSCWYRGDWV